MPAPWTFVGPVLVIATEGVYARSDLELAVTEALADPRFRPGAPVMFDGRRSDVTPSTADIQWRIDWAASLPRRGFGRRIAILIREEAFQLGLSRQLSSWLEGRGVEVTAFHAEEAALAWLNQPPE
jgi:hypothetical protein